MFYIVTNDGGLYFSRLGNLNNRLWTFNKSFAKVFKVKNEVLEFANELNKCINRIIDATIKKEDFE